MGRNGQMERSIFDRTGPTEKSGPPRKVGQFFRNFSGWTEPIHSLLDRNFRKFWLNGSRPAHLCTIMNEATIIMESDDDAEEELYKSVFTKAETETKTEETCPIAR